MLKKEKIAFKIKALLIFICSPVNAGGSGSPVKLIAFSQYDDAFTLVVKPLPNSDYYMDKCDVFVVNGKYNKPWTHYFNDFMPSREMHQEALNFLRKRPKQFFLGWIGKGFYVLNNYEPCIVTSNSLELVKDGSETQIISFFKE